jgi:hypothetical protein
LRKNNPLSTNRSNNRRRGRGNNRGPGGGGSQGNRIDSRARGNAPQLLEKYRKLAHDASLNDDRVQTEYYLQFADHYFRVLADSKTPKDEQRGGRPYGDRDEAEEYTDGDDAPYYERTQEPRGNGSANGQRSDYPQQQPQQQQRPDRSRPEAAPEVAEDDWAGEGTRGFEGDAGEGSDNPFVREPRSRAPRGRERREPRPDHSAQERPAPREGGLDAMSLPPSIVRGSEGDEGTQAEIQSEAEATAPAKPARAPRTAKPRAPRTRTRLTRPAEDGDPEALEAVS